MIPVDALIFDLDGTLIDSKRDLAISVQFLQKHYNVRPSSAAQVAAFVGDGVVKLVQRALPNLAPSKLEQAIGKFKAFYREHCLRYTRAYPGVRETLKHFRQKKMAIVTNKPVRISGYMLDELGLSPYFDVLIGGDSLPNKKPHPEPLLNAMKTMRINKPNHVIMVGDSANDILAGKAARTLTCGILSNIGNHQMLLSSGPDFTVKCMTDLIRIFA